MGEWGFLGGLFDNLQAHSPMLGRFWLFIMLVFRILILGTVASDMFEDEQEEFACNTLQPGCKQVCYDMAFPISQYRFWVFHIVLISTPSLLFLMYAMHHHNKKKSSSRFSQMSTQDYRQELHMRRLYIVNVAFRMVVEVGFLVGQWWLYGFKVEAQFPCSRFPCPYTVDCFTSRPAEKTIFLCFYFVVGVVAAISSFAELCYASLKWFCPRRRHLHRGEHACVCQNLHNLKQDEAEEDEKPRGRTMSESVPGSVRLKGGSVRSGSSRKVSSFSHKQRSGKYLSSRTLMV
ncbi:gap junction delta-3 protein-like [Centroberyx affinis]|uniref:gap junction delta-3 protein-like n=1 Tax=Centroberyx affinis TaxID=166261 RepID=UPI003A5BBC9B